MKDEEMAEKYKESKRHKCFRADVGKIQIEYEAYLNNLKDGFLAGLKAGRPQWHDLRKDKNDLPEEYKIVLCYYVRGYHENEAIYGYNLFTRKEIISSRNMIAWCEIPTFDKE